MCDQNSENDKNNEASRIEKFSESGYLDPIKKKMTRIGWGLVILVVTLILLVVRGTCLILTPEFANLSRKQIVMWSLLVIFFAVLMFVIVQNLCELYKMLSSQYDYYTKRALQKYEFDEMIETVDKITMEPVPKHRIYEKIVAKKLDLMKGK